MTAADRTGARAAHGFALVELLVALSLLALLAAMLGSGVALAGRLTMRQTAAHSAADAVGNTQLILRERLQRLAPLPQIGRDDRTVEVRGRPTLLAWLAPAPGQSQPDSYLFHRLQLMPDGTLTLFTVSDLDRRIDVHAPGLAGWTPHPLLRDVRGLDLAYFGVDPVTGERRWLSDWQEQGAPPDLVRVRLAFPPGDLRQWPDLIVRPRTTVNTACRIDPLTGRCA